MSEGELARKIKELNEQFPYDFGYDMGIGGIIEDAKKELFDSMVTHSEMHLHPIEDICGDKQWVRIPYQEYWQLMRHWIVLKKWFGAKTE